ncbi:MAG TPA: NYN domain-containing protein [Acidimicrobiia bacterium]|nr:NYN domain-containing protein [Acidimicrobiia bacterium]
MDQTAEHLFRRALEAAAKALRDLKANQIPADLRRVARRPWPLPPPLAVSLLKGIDRYDWLREKALEAWSEADGKATGPDQASALLLLRPPGWTGQVAALAADLGGDEARSTGEDLERHLQAAQAEAGEWKRRARAETQKARREAREARDVLAEERALRQALQAAPAREKAARDEAAERLSAQVAGATAERDAARRESRRLRQEVAAQRRGRAAAEAQVAEAGGKESWEGDPVGLAAYLDRTAVMARPPAPGHDPRATAEPPALRLPRGIRPDQKEAVDWLVGRTEATTLIVDGYNAAFLITGSRDPRAGRERLLGTVDRLRRVARGALRVVVVFDSGLEAAFDEVLPATVEVRYTAEAGGGDREIAELVAELGGARVVVSTDREVREAAEGAGALALWSEALVEWEKRR